MIPPNDDALKGFVAQREKSFLQAPTLRVNQKADELSVSNRIALGDATVRRNISYVIMALFAGVNIATLVFLHSLFLTDQRDLQAKLISADGRVVTSSVLMTLLGATTVQLGTVMVIMARYLFRPVDGGEV